MIGIEWVLAYLGLGTFVGLMAGLFGIGGGAIMVPALTLLFFYQGIDPNQIVHLALGTSMASIVMTAVSSVRAQQKRGNIDWSIVWGVAPGVCIGAFLLTFVVAASNSVFLALVFIGFMMYSAAMMVFSPKPKTIRPLPSKPVLGVVGLLIGGLSSMVSVAGGILLTPFLLWHSVPFRVAIACSAAMGLMTALSGTAGYLIHDNTSSSVAMSIGFIYLPATVLISITSVVFAPIGVTLAHALPVETLRKWFAVFIVGMSFQMLWAVFH